MLVQAQPASRDGSPAKIARGSPWRASRRQGGIRTPPKMTSGGPKRLFRITCVAPSSPITPSRTPLSPVDRARYDCPSASPLYNRTPSSFRALVATSFSHPDCRATAAGSAAPAAPVPASRLGRFAAAHQDQPSKTNVLGRRVAASRGFAQPASEPPVAFEAARTEAAAMSPSRCRYWLSPLQGRDSSAIGVSGPLGVRVGLIAAR